MNDIDRLIAAADRLTAALERVAPLMERWVAADERMAALGEALVPGAAGAAEPGPEPEWRIGRDGKTVEVPTDDGWRSATPAEATALGAVRQPRRGR